MKSWLSAKEEVVISIAPSYQVIWDNYAKLKQNLYKLGFSAVEETAKGASVVSAQYGALMHEKKMNNIIETCCPTVVEMIEKEYPDVNKLQTYNPEQYFCQLTRYFVHIANLSEKKKYFKDLVTNLTHCFLF